MLTNTEKKKSEWKHLTEYLRLLEQASKYKNPELSGEQNFCGHLAGQPIYLKVLFQRAEKNYNRFFFC